MKRLFLAILVLTTAFSVSAQGWFAHPTPNDTLRSVIVDGSAVLFQIYAPKARQVSVAGDLPWGVSIPFSRTENGVWQGRLESIDPGVYRYSFVVDGVSVQDPKSELAGETRALLRVGTSTDEFFAKKGVPHGAVAQRWYYSRTLQSMRRMHVWTPAGYEKSADCLPVLYLVHGGGDNDASWPAVGAAGWILDNLLAEGKMVPMIVVMPNGTIETDSLEGEVPLFARDLMEDIIPFVEANYRVQADPAHRAMAGLSMGGMETLEVLLDNPESFDCFWVLSSGWFDRGDAFVQYGRRLDLVGEVINRSVSQLVFTQGGPSDIAYQNCKNMLQKLFDPRGIRYEYKENAQAGHSWATWRADLMDMAPRLFRDKR